MFLLHYKQKEKNLPGFKKNKMRDSTIFPCYFVCLFLSKTNVTVAEAEFTEWSKTDDPVIESDDFGFGQSSVSS